MPDVRMVSLGFGKYARSDKVFALERWSATSAATDGVRGCGSRACPSPIVASRTEVTILRDMGEEAAADVPVLDEALDLAARLAAAADAGRVDLSDLGRRARRVLASTTQPQLPADD